MRAISGIRAGVLVALVGLAGVALAPGCAGAPGAPWDDDGRIVVFLNGAPADVLCVRLYVAGSSRGAVREIAVVAGAPVTADLSGLPTGSVQVRADAFPLACGAIDPVALPTWRSEVVTITLEPGVRQPLALVMLPNGVISIGVDWTADALSDGGAAGSG